MPMNQTDIANMALAHIGEGVIISFSDETPSARAVSRFYHHSREQVLRDHLWSFAKRRKKLNRLSDPPSFGWGISYQLPENCLRVWGLNKGDNDEGDNAPFTVDGRILMTNEETAEIIYVSDIKDSTQFDPTFIDSLSLLLAGKLARILTGSSDLDERMLARYERQLRVARKQDSNESRQENVLPFNSRSIRARFGFQ